MTKDAATARERAGEVAALFRGPDVVDPLTLAVATGRLVESVLATGRDPVDAVEPEGPPPCEDTFSGRATYLRRAGNALRAALDGDGPAMLRAAVASEAMLSTAAWLSERGKEARLDSDHGATWMARLGPIALDVREPHKIIPWGRRFLVLLDGAEDVSEPGGFTVHANEGDFTAYQAMMDAWSRRQGAE